MQLLNNQLLYKTIVQTKSFQSKLDTYRVHSHLTCYKKRKAVQVTVNSFTSQIANNQKQFVELDKLPMILPDSEKHLQNEMRSLIEQQVTTLLNTWRDIDTSVKVSHEIYRDQYGEEYVEESAEELDAAVFKKRFDRTDDEESWTVADRSKKEADQQVNMSNKRLLMLQRIEQQRLSDLEDKVFETIGFVPTVKQSDIAHGELGLWIKGRCSRGAVVGIYPGMVYNGTSFAEKYCYGRDLANRKAEKCTHIAQFIPGIHGVSYVDGKLWNQPFFETLYNHQIQNEEDHYIQKQKGLFSKLKESIIGEERTETEYGHEMGLRFIHPFARLQYANHLPCSTRNGSPNLIAAPMTIPFDFKRDLIRYIPNKAYSHPAVLFSDFGLVRTVVFIATRNIENEELSIDYRWSPQMQSAHGSWYRSDDKQQDERLWR